MAKNNEYDDRLDDFISTMRGQGTLSLPMYYAAVAGQQAQLGSPSARLWWSRVSDYLERQEDSV